MLQTNHVSKTRTQFCFLFYFTFLYLTILQQMEASQPFSKLKLFVVSILKRFCSQTLSLFLRVESID